MKGVGKRKRRFDQILDLLIILASALLVFMMCAVCYDVIARYFFNSPTTWVGEISGIILLFLPFLIGGWVLKKDGHVKMDLLLDMMPPRTQIVLRIITSFMALLTCLILCYYGIRISWQLYENNYFTDTYLRLPKGPLIAVIPLGFLLLLVQFVRKIRAEFKAWRRLKADRLRSIASR